MVDKKLISQWNVGVTCKQYLSASGAGRFERDAATDVIIQRSIPTDLRKHGEINNERALPHKNGVLQCVEMFTSQRSHCCGQGGQDLSETRRRHGASAQPNQRKSCGENLFYE